MEANKKKISNNQWVNLYTPESYLRKPLRFFLEMMRDLSSSKELAIALARRDISAQYRQSILGYLWAFLPVIGTTAIFIFLRSGGAFSTGDLSIPYPVYILIGTICWQIFVDSVNGPLKVVATSKAMLIKVNFPRESLILAGALITIFNFIVRLIILIPSLFFFYTKGMYVFVPSSVVLFPLGVLALMVFGYTIGLLLTPIGILYSDIFMGLQMIMMFWMFISPVVITIPQSGLVSKVMNFNPVTPLLDSTRSWLIGVAPLHLTEFFIVFGLSLFFLLCGWILYRVALPHVIARLGM